MAQTYQDSGFLDDYSTLTREAKGIELPSNQALTLEMLKRVIDEWAAAAANEITAQLRSSQ